MKLSLKDGETTKYDWMVGIGDGVLTLFFTSLSVPIDAATGMTGAKLPQRNPCRLILEREVFAI